MRFSNRLVKKFATRSGMLLAAALALSACSSGGTSASDVGEGESLPVGASKEEYIEALSEMEPVKLVMETGDTSTAPQAGPVQDFADAVYEWSDGKIEFEIMWSYGISGYDDMPDAVADGRIDLGMKFSPGSFPSEFPANELIQAALLKAPSSPVEQTLVMNGALQEIAWEYPAIYEEVEAKGVKVLSPAFSAFGQQTFTCKDERTAIDDISGASMRVGGGVNSSIAENLGVEPVSIGFLETYEGLQRGVMDCTWGPIHMLSSMGWPEVAPNITVPETTLGQVPNVSMVNERTWDELPLAARQLIFDKITELENSQLEVFFDQQLPEIFANIDELGAELVLPDNDLETAVEAEAQRVVDGLDGHPLANGSEFSDLSENVFDKWNQQLDEAGYVTGGDWVTFSETHEAGEVDLGNFQEMMVELRENYRP